MGFFGAMTGPQDLHSIVNGKMDFITIHTDFRSGQRGSRRVFLAKVAGNPLALMAGAHNHKRRRRPAR